MAASDRDCLPSVDAARFDYERYRHHLDRLDLPESARRRLGEAVWAVLHNHVERAWGDDPVQQLRGLGDRFNEDSGADSAGVVGSAQSPTIKGPASMSAASKETR